MLGSLPWGWVVPQGRSWVPSRVSVVQGVSNRKAWAGNGPCGLLHVKLWDLGQDTNTQEDQSSLGFQTTMQKKAGRWQTWDHTLCYFLGQIMNLCLILVGSGPWGVCAAARSVCKNTAQRAPRVDVSNHPALAELCSQEVAKPAWEDRQVTRLQAAQVLP